MEANDFLGGLYTSLEETYNSAGQEGLRLFLKRTRDDYTRRYGLNHWRRALIDSLSDNVEFLDAGFITALELQSEFTGGDEYVVPTNSSIQFLRVNMLSDCRLFVLHFYLNEQEQPQLHQH